MPVAATYDLHTMPPQLHNSTCYCPAGLGVLGYAIATFKRWGDEFGSVPKFLICFGVMVVELLWENCMVW